MIPAGLKHLLRLRGPHLLALKPASIVTVSTGSGGSYPVAELRMSIYKNTGVCYITEHTILRQVGGTLEGEEPASGEDSSFRKRIDYSSRALAGILLG